MFTLIMVYVLSQKTTTINVDFNSKEACERAGMIIQRQMHVRKGVYPDVFVCAAKG